MCIETIFINTINIEACTTNCAAEDTQSQATQISFMIETISIIKNMQKLRNLLSLNIY